MRRTPRAKRPCRASIGSSVRAGPSSQWRGARRGHQIAATKEAIEAMFAFHYFIEALFDFICFRKGAECGSIMKYQHQIQDVSELSSRVAQHFKKER